MSLSALFKFPIFSISGFAENIFVLVPPRDLPVLGGVQEMAHDRQRLQALELRLAQAGNLRTLRDQGRTSASSYSNKIRRKFEIPGALK